MWVHRQRIAVAVAACLAAAAGLRPEKEAEGQVLAAVQRHVQKDRKTHRSGRTDCDPAVEAVCVLPARKKPTKAYTFRVTPDFDSNALHANCNAEGVYVNCLKTLPFCQVECQKTDIPLMMRLVEGQEEGVKYLEQDSELAEVAEVVNREVADHDPPAEEAASTLWHLDRIATDRRKNQGEGVHAYIVDSGINCAHDDFGGRAIPGFHWRGVAGSATGRAECAAGDEDCSRDGEGHGTHVAGSVGGTTYGVAPKATLVAVKVLNDQGIGSFSSTIAGLDFVASSTTRPAVAVMSLGGPGSDQGMTDAVTEVMNHGVIVVVASGNSGEDGCDFTPNHIPGAIVVGATGRQDEMPWWSNYGPCVDIFAPGDDIVSARHDSSQEGASSSGTSMACPLVAGGAVLLLAETPTLTQSGVLEHLLADAGKNQLDDLSTADQNVLLYVGSDAPPPDKPGNRTTFEHPAHGAAPVEWPWSAPSAAPWSGPAGLVFPALLLWSFGL